MKHYNKKELTDITCDLCKKKITPLEPEAIDEVNITHKKGRIAPGGFGGGYLGFKGEILQVDMCGNCFFTKLIPWLATQGAHSQTATIG